MSYVGDFATGATVRWMYRTNDQSGAAAAGASGTIRVYKDSSNVERTSSSGVTHTRSYDSVAGINFLAIDLSDNADAGFYAAAHDYFVALVTETVDGVSVSAPLFGFSVQNRYNTVGATLSASERDSVADAILDRDMSTGADNGSPTVRTVRQALRMMRNKVSRSGSTLTVTKEDDATASWTASLSTDASAEPITAINPAGP